MLQTHRSSLHIAWMLLAGCAFVLAPAPAHAQQRPATPLDSLRGALQQYGSAIDTSVVNLHLALAEAYGDVNSTLGSRHSDSALQLSKRMGFARGHGDAANWLGRFADSRADYTNALRYYFEALRVRQASGDELGAARTQGNIGSVFMVKDSLEKARGYFESSYETFRRLHDTVGMARRLESIGELYERRGDLDLAARLFESAATLARAINRKDIEADAIGSAAMVLNRHGHYEQAVRKCFLALSLCEDMGDRQGVVRHTGNIGGCYYDAAVDSIASAQPSRYIPAERNAKLQLAIRYLRQAVDSARAIGYLKAVEYFSRRLSDAHSAAGNTALAFESFRSHIEARDSIYSVESATRIEQLENEQELLLRDKQIELDRLAVTKKRNERTYFIAGLGLLGIVIFFVARERKKSERLLLNILPGKIAARLKAKQHPIADSFSGVSIMFIDMVGFTQFVERHGPTEIVSILNDVFTRFDALAEEHGLEKIKTIGDSYMAVAGVPTPCDDHADRAARMALAACRSMKNYMSPEGEPIRFRIGLDCGPVVAGVIGRKKFIYDLWGDAVNTAARMESSGVEGEIQCTDHFRRCCSGAYSFTALGLHPVKGKGEMKTWFLREAAIDIRTDFPEA